ncbi:MAG: glycosyltransferase family 4 protein [Actinomycetota bacterium]
MIPPPSGGNTIAFVPPRFGDGVVGGAEAVVSEMARALAALGLSVEILTTCARDHFTWANEFPAGDEQVGDIVVRRFPTVVDTPGVHRRRLGDRILAGDTIDLASQQLWINDSLRVPDLWHYVLDHGERYRAIVLAPYLFWTTYAVGQVLPARTIVMPCLHDEPMARLDIFKPLMEGARGVWFLTDPEAELAGELFDVPRRNAVVGAGIDVVDTHDPDAFRSEYGVEGPFLYYAGRREWGKGWLQLVEAFGRLLADGVDDLQLVTSGVGDIEAPEEVRRRIVDVGFLSDAMRDNAMAAASAYVQPSALESFSRTVLEAWAAGTPVIANAGSAVVSWHVERSGAGLLYRGTSELTEALRFAAEEPTALAALAGPGRHYVSEHYRWSDVVDRMLDTLDRWLPTPALATAGAPPMPPPSMAPPSTAPASAPDGGIEWGSDR